MKKFDLILVYSFGRENLFFLSIIKYLSLKYKIGLFLHDDKNFINRPHNKTFRKIKETEKSIRHLCVELGAEKVYSNEKVHCKLLLMYPLEYESDYLENIKKNIKYDKLIGLFFHARGFRNLNLLKDMGAVKYFAPGKYLLEMIFKHEKSIDQIKGLDIIEAGYPYKTYSVFKDENIDIDYLVAMPSSSLLKSNQGKARWRFFKTLKKGLSQIKDNDKIYLKHHNVRDKQRYYSRLPGGIFLLKIGAIVFELIAKFCPMQNLKNRLYYNSARFLYSIIELKYPSFEKLTKSHNYGWELFLPYVKKGVFTGLSGTIFHSLYNNVPVYNCDPQEVKDDFAPFYKYFKLPYINGKLNFDKKYFDLIPQEVRDADIIKLIEKEIKK